jgi:hypothetical protein
VSLEGGERQGNRKGEGYVRRRKKGIEGEKSLSPSPSPEGGKGTSLTDEDAS